MTVAVGRLRSMGLAKESTLGTIIQTPTRYLNFIPPDSFFPSIEPLPSKGIEALADMFPKITPGPATLNGMKLKLEMEPENIGEILQALTGLDTKTGPTDTTAYTHTFARQAVGILPTYSFWFDKNPKYPLFGGCMLSKMDISAKAKGIVELDTEWDGIAYDDSDGTSKSPTYSALVPFCFQNVTVNIDGSPVVGYDNLKISFNNMVKADHVLESTDAYPKKIYSEGYEVQVSADLFFEDTTQYAKFIAGTTAHFNIVFTSPQLITGAASTKYSLTVDLPLVYYKSANLTIPTNGVLKVPFVGLCKYSFSGSVYTAQLTLVNGVSTQY